LANFGTQVAEMPQLLRLLIMALTRWAQARVLLAVRAQRQKALARSPRKQQPRLHLLPWAGRAQGLLAALALLPRKWRQRVLLALRVLGLAVRRRCLRPSLWAVLILLPMQALPSPPLQAPPRLPLLRPSPVG
jgi:hypothetical protein